MKEGLLFILGLVLLVGGGEYMVRGAVALSKRLSVSALVIGIVIVGFGTSVPELLASLFAVVKMGSPELHFGNIIGSNIANILLILGLTAMINPVVFPAKPSKRDIVFLVLSLVFLGAAVFLFEKIDIFYGVFLTIAMMVYIVWSFMGRGSENEDIPELTGLYKYWAFSLLITVLGIGVMIFGAQMMVENAVKIARDWQVSEKVIGLTIVAIGTSLPELTASLLSAIHKRSDLAVGNIIGSNIFNIILIPGLTAIVNKCKNGETIIVAKNALMTDYLVMAVVTAVFIVFAIKGRIGRLSGALFFAAYVAYLILIWG